MQFAVSVPGKWILAGEHAVIRNHPAIVFPLLSRKLELRFSDSMDFGAIAPELESAISRAFSGAEKFLAQKQRRFHIPRGNFSIASTIPLSAGLGSSAALCVALGRFLVHAGTIREPELFDCARAMEDIFHGKSSGMDLAVAIHESPLRYQRESGAYKIALGWNPKFYLSDSGIRSSTADSVRKVEALRSKNRGHFESLDQKMRASVDEALRALEGTEAASLDRLSGAIQAAYECFSDWDLIPAAVQEKITALKANGALAAKPTGSGAGGFILSLWKNPPPQGLGLLPADLARTN